MINIYFFILVFLVLLYYFIKKLNKFPYVRNNSTNIEFLDALDKLHVNNLSYEIFLLFVYFACYFLLFLLLRLYNLGRSVNVNTLGLYSITGYTIVNIIIFLLCIVYYINIINTLFYPTIIKLHYYFYQYDWYENIVDRMHMEFSIIIDKIERMQKEILYCFDEKWVNKFWDSNMSFCKKEGKALLEKKRNRQLQLIRTIKSNIILYYLATIILQFLALLSEYRRLIYYVVYIIILFLFFHELYTGIIHYIYFAFAGYFIILWAKKIRYFYIVKDPIDHSITRYLYKNDIPYNTIRNTLVEHDLNDVIDNLGENTQDLLQYKNELIPYILNDFVNRNQRYPSVNKSNKSINNEKKRKLKLLFLISLLSYYTIYSNKYMITILSINITFWLFSMVAMIMLFLLNRRILYRSNEIEEYGNNVWMEKKKFKYTFNVTFIVLLGIILYIMLKNKLTLFPEEIILQWHTYIKIEEHFSLEEKQQYILSYFDAIKQILPLTDMQRMTLYNKIKQGITLHDSMTMEMIRTAIDNIINTWDPNNKLSYPFKQKDFLNIMTKIVDWIKNLWS